VEMVLRWHSMDEIAKNVEVGRNLIPGYLQYCKWWERFDICGTSTAGRRSLAEIIFKLHD